MVRRKRENRSWWMANQEAGHTCSLLFQTYPKCHGIYQSGYVWWENVVVALLCFSKIIWYGAKHIQFLAKTGIPFPYTAYISCAWAWPCFQTFMKQSEMRFKKCETNSHTDYTAMHVHRHFVHTQASQAEILTILIKFLIGFLISFYLGSLLSILHLFWRWA